MGKGSKPRPIQIPRDEYERRWRETFARVKRLSDKARELRETAESGEKGKQDE